MDHRWIINRLAENAAVIQGMAQLVAAGQASWKPSAEDWSMLEVINHLYDEEREDFRKRIELVLEDPASEWPPIDPEGWVVERKYNDRDLAESVQRFLEERDKSISWLANLGAPPWGATHHHPRLGPMTAEQLLANWLAHDLLHLRQLTELHWAYLAHVVEPISLDYAGSW